MSGYRVQTRISAVASPNCWTCSLNTTRIGATCGATTAASVDRPQVEAAGLCAAGVVKVNVGRTQGSAGAHVGVVVGVLVCGGDLPHIRATQFDIGLGDGNRKSIFHASSEAKNGTFTPFNLVPVPVPVQLLTCRRPPGSHEAAGRAEVQAADGYRSWAATQQGRHW